MKILLFGASGSGTTTLGKAIAEKTKFVHLDADDYYWKPTTPAFQQKVPLAIRYAYLTADFHQFEQVIVSGSLVSWGKAWETAFDLAVFIYLENSLRMARLREREKARLGDLLLTNEAIRQQSEAFLDWADQYENPNFSGRSLAVHRKWMALLACPVLEIDGQMALADKVDIVLKEI